LNIETVTWVHHWTDKTFSFKTTRNKSFRFINGEFAMIGLPSEEENGRPLLRAYSIASANYEDELEFLSIKVPDGPLTSRLQHLKVGDEVICMPKTTGTLTIDNLTVGDNLYLLSTGTGLAPFMSIIRDPETYEKFKNVILVHTTRTHAEHTYIKQIEEVASVFALKYYDTCTQEEYIRKGRLWEHIDLITNGGFNKETDRVMVCGGPEMNYECRDYFEEHGFIEGNLGEPNDFVLERAFVD
jgi:ferredoxin--NADP+ reductase|tara:strand:+ start:4594 stop:5319 length:726 start_codon:yes stop_codon:yes gene_type:complete